MSRSFDETLPAHILFGDSIEPEFKDAMCKVMNKYHLPDSKSMAINLETGKWKLLEPGDKVPEGMTALPLLSQMINAFPNVCFYSIPSVIKAINILNLQTNVVEAMSEDIQPAIEPVKKLKTRRPKSKRKK